MSRRSLLLSHSLLAAQALKVPALAVVATLFLPSCLAYNPECEPDNTEIIGYTDTLLDLRQSFVRTREAPIGNLVADSFLEHFGGQADIALVNSGSIAESVDCDSSGFIDRGPIRMGQISNMLPYDNQVVRVQMSGADIRQALEHAVARLGLPGESGAATRFLQVAKLHFTVNCARAAQGDGVVGQRIGTPIKILNTLGEWVDLDENEGGTPQLYSVATTSFLADGGDDFEWMRTLLPDANPGDDFVVVAAYLTSLTSVAPAFEGRIQLDDNCQLRYP